MFERIRHRERVLPPVLNSTFQYEPGKMVHMSIERDGWTSLRAHGKVILGCAEAELEEIGQGNMQQGAIEVMQQFDVHLSPAELVILASDATAEADSL